MAKAMLTTAPRTLRLVTETEADSTIVGAIRLAQAAINLRKAPNGNGWHVETYDPTRGRWDKSDPIPWPEAIERKRVAVIARALQRIGWDLTDAYAVAVRSGGRAEDVIARVLA